MAAPFVNILYRVARAQRSILAFVAASVVVCGCGVFKGIGSDLGEGLSGKGRAIADSALLGVQNRISDAEFKAAIAHLLDSAMTAWGTSTNKQVVALRDSLRDERWKVFASELIEELSGAHTRGNVAALREELLGHRSQELIQTLLNTLLSDSIDGKVADLRNELLGPVTEERAAALLAMILGQNTKESLASIVDTAAYRVSTRLDDTMGKNLPLIKKYATEILVAIGAIAAVIVFLVWRNRQKYLKLSKLLSQEVSEIPDRKAYDELTYRIQGKALLTGQEETLKKLLEESGLLGNEAWEERRKKRLNARPQLERAQEGT